MDSVSIQDVAKRAGVSIATVSRVLSGSAAVRPATVEKVKCAIAELNYVPNSSARSLSSGKGGLFGVIISDITNPFFPDLIHTFDEFAVQYNRQAIFSNTNYSPRRAELCIRNMLERNVEGLAVMTSEMSPHLLDQVRTRGIPVVCLDYDLPECNIGNILVNYSQGIHQALDHLTLLGHKRIGFIAGPGHLASALRRRDAFLESLAEKSVHFEPRWIAGSNHRVDGGYNAMRRILTEQVRPTAILASNDLTAIGAISAIHDAGLQVPRDISVVGFDDIDMSANFVPPLTTVRLSRREIASAAFFYLYAASHADTPLTTEHRIDTQLVIRRSAAGPADH
jgi:LacI family transcriptional regulator